MANPQLNIEPPELESDSDDDNIINPFQDINSKYITEKELGQFFNFDDKNSINMLHINARSLKKNFCNIESLLANIPGLISAIAITETWLSESIKEVFFIPNYTFVSNSREKKMAEALEYICYRHLNLRLDMT